MYAFKSECGDHMVITMEWIQLFLKISSLSQGFHKPLQWITCGTELRDGVSSFPKGSHGRASTYKGHLVHDDTWKVGWLKHV